LTFEETSTKWDLKGFDCLLETLGLEPLTSTAMRHGPPHVLHPRTSEMTGICMLIITNFIGSIHYKLSWPGARNTTAEAGAGREASHSRPASTPPKTVQCFNTLQMRLISDCIALATQQQAQKHWTIPAYSTTSKQTCLSTQQHNRSNHTSSKV
jgi:hypothetical protein